MSSQQPAPGDDAVNPALIDAAIEHVRASIGYELDEEAVTAVRENVERQLKLGAKLRAYPLRNADEPDFTFRPYRAEG